jgi:hypothetical protein
MLIDITQNHVFYDLSMSMPCSDLFSGEGERDGDLEGLRETYREPASDGDPWRLRLGLLEARERSTLGLLVRLLLLLEVLLPIFSFPSSLSPSIAASNRLLRGPISPFSSNICLF